VSPITDVHGVNMTNEIFIGRQPILDSDRRTFGYELLYRNGPDTAMLSESPDDATRCVMERALLQWGVEKIIGNRFGLINASASFVASGLHRAMPPEGIIFEICESTPFDGPTFDALVRARYDGHHFALDNVTRLSDLVGSRLLPHASIVKIELRNALDNEIPRLIEVARERAPGVLVVAEKVETADDFARCLEFGFDLFQGYFFAAPEVLKRPARPANVASAMALLAEMQRTDIDIDRVEELVGSDPSLTFRLLAIANSSAFGLDRRVDSLRHTIILLGLGQAPPDTSELIALSTAPGASEELITLGATRARMISSLVSGGASSSIGFTVGLLSVTDAIYNTPMSELVGELPVSAEIASALVDSEGELGRALDIVRACEAGDVARLVELDAGSFEHLRHMYAEAVEWSDDRLDQPCGPLRDGIEGFVERQLTPLCRREPTEVATRDLVAIRVGEARHPGITARAHRLGLLRQRATGVDEEQVEALQFEFTTGCVPQPRQFVRAFDQRGEIHGVRHRRSFRWTRHDGASDGPLTVQSMRRHATEIFSAHPTSQRTHTPTRSTIMWAGVADITQISPPDDTTVCDATASERRGFCTDVDGCGRAQSQAAT